MRSRRRLFSDEFVNQLAAAVAARVAQSAPVARRLMPVKEAAEYIGRSTRALEHLIQRGTVPVTKIGGRVQVDRVALDKLIEESTYFET